MEYKIVGVYRAAKQKASGHLMDYIKTILIITNIIKDIKNEKMKIYFVKNIFFQRTT